MDWRIPNASVAFPKRLIACRRRVLRGLAVLAMTERGDGQTSSGR
jgi:hypothetical protein